MSTKRFRSLALLTLLFVAGTPFAAWAETLTGRVVGITDGDTLTLLTTDKQPVKIRLAEIDTPEKRQPYGKRAKQALSKLAYRKQARVKVVTTDRYGRTIGQVYVGKTWVNKALVCGGHAWVYRRYAHSPALFQCEKDARRDKRGLWALPEAQRTPPWEWRHGEKRSTKAPILASGRKTDGNFTCGSKRYCKEMRSCAEAKFYLNQCGLSRLDGDGDGVPCESLCR